jgi:hypothetical protein
MTLDHRFALIGGSYQCQDCDYSTTLNWAAMQHTADENGIDVDVVNEKLTQ